MPNVNNKNLTSQAHAASQVNGKPTTKANISSVENNSKINHPGDFLGTNQMSEWSAKGILLNNGKTDWLINEDMNDWAKINLDKVPKSLKEFFIHEYQVNNSLKGYPDEFDRMNKGCTRLANENILLKEKLLDKVSPFTFYSGSQNRRIDLKTAPKAIEYMFDYSEDFTRYKDALTRCMYLIGIDEDNITDKKEFLDNLYLMFDFFTDLQNDVNDN